jgi:hypothetical protein
MKHSKRAIWAACNSDQGDRLLEIAREHIRLVREIRVAPPGSSGPRDWVNDESHEIILARIEALRAERDAIIKKFEEVGSSAGNSTTDNTISQ